LVVINNGNTEDYLLIMAILRTISIKKELDEKTKKHCSDTGKSISGLISVLLIKYFLENTQEKECIISNIEIRDENG